MPPKTVLITGGSSGIGKFTAEMFLSKGDIVLFTGWSESGLKSASEWITAGLPKVATNFHGMVLDLEDSDSTDMAANKFKGAKSPQTGHYLCQRNQAAVPYPQLLPCDTEYMLFIISSPYENADLSKRDYNGYAFYRLSKLVQFLLTLLLSEQVQDQNIKANLMCPGFVPWISLARESSVARFLLRARRFINGIDLAEAQSTANYYKVITNTNLNDVRWLISGKEN
ncbi:hypothetical protein BX666DRAFT_2022235 [Dichotomocladium elegans]|nr:hypothetical protein BX666DRAFT_2022235 [Dichotomocladium elegans]